MGIKIKHRDPKSTDFSSTDIIININEGTLFYKTPTGLFKLQGDNLNTSIIEGGGGGEGGVSSFNDLTDVPLGIYSSSLQILGNITSSGNISGSGNLIVNDITSVNNITSSGNISGSSSTSTFTAVTGSFDTQTKMITTIPLTATIGSTDTTYFSFYHTGDTTVDTNYYTRYVPPYSGRVLKLTLGTIENNPGNVTIRIRKDAGGDFDIGSMGDIIGQQTINSVETHSIYDFDDWNSNFSKGDVLGVSYAQSNAVDVDIMATLVIEFDMTT
tara:strand:- start:646 stop:1458 length:813 start_codon:yes stop_codon:yes gene_type:complete